MPTRSCSTRAFRQARGARGQAAVAERMRELLAGAPFDPRAPDRLVQDPYPFRVLPQVDGVAHDALRRRSTTCSPASSTRAPRTP